MDVHQINQHLALRLVDLDDAEGLFTLTNTNRDYLKQWLPWLNGTKRVEDTRAFIHKAKLAYDDQKGMTFVILWKEKIVGVISYNSIDWTNKIAYIGYWLSAAVQGNGIMTKSTKFLTDYAFSHLNMNRVEIAAAVENKKSRAIPERLGFQLEGIRREAEWLYDHYVDHAIYGMLKREWDTKKKKME
ncbi:GNAT family N-acetyltransferase [Fervidibacillus halotolerans]|uniref:GNAT family N-acetyltransferase n=1 Tax=Fervidibacillus halotolerans TaxID=2980027 RepID=A0A9E8RY79_9BACI|nr:GNAT family protein [Fervidibacillus halotolerans]WAA13530.1 GNAT family N-acetyltransferase [Fervidibacillus halotolerans]